MVWLHIAVVWLNGWPDVVVWWGMGVWWVGLESGLKLVVTSDDADIRFSCWSLKSGRGTRVLGGGGEFGSKGLDNFILRNQ